MRAPSACQASSCAFACFTSGRSSAGINCSGSEVPSAGKITQSGFKSAVMGCTGMISPCAVRTFFRTPTTDKSK